MFRHHLPVRIISDEEGGWVESHGCIIEFGDERERERGGGMLAPNITQSLIEENNTVWKIPFQLNV